MKIQTLFPIRAVMVFGLVSGLSLPILAESTNLVSAADTGLFEYNPDNNLGGKDYVIAGTINQGFKARALFKFPVASALPSNATVTSVTLLLNVPVANGIGQGFGLHRLLRDWGEGTGTGGGSFTPGHGAPANPGEATWNARFHPGTLWNVAGGQADTDYVAGASATATMDSSSLNFSSAGMAADVQAWLNNSGTNFGWIVIVTNEATLRTASHIATREDTVNAPVLTVQYTVPAPPPAPNIANVALVGNAIRFSFNAQSNHAHTVEFRDSLGPTNWNTLTNIPALPGDTILNITNTVSSAERYFRVGAQ